MSSLTCEGQGGAGTKWRTTLPSGDNEKTSSFLCLSDPWRVGGSSSNKEQSGYLLVELATIVLPFLHKFFPQEPLAVE